MSSNKIDSSSSLFNQIATELYEPEQVLGAIESQNRRTRETGNGFVAPSNPIEREVAAVWAEALNLDQVGIHDNFFKLGGNSVLGIQVLSRLSDSFQVELSMRTLFETPTVASMAISIMQAQAKQLDRDQVEGLLDEIADLPEVDLELLDADEIQSGSTIR